jgi:DNA-binding NtrC family response regulator
MVVDDAYSELRLVETILHSAGYDVVTYLGGDQLEEKLVKSQPDVVRKVPRKSILPRP